MHCGWCRSAPATCCCQVGCTDTAANNLSPSWTTRTKPFAVVSANAAGAAHGITSRPSVPLARAYMFACQCASRPAWQTCATVVCLSVSWWSRLSKNGSIQVDFLLSQLHCSLQPQRTLRQGWLLTQRKCCQVQLAHLSHTQAQAQAQDHR